MRGVTSISLPNNFRSKLKKISHLRGLTLSEMIREALRQYLVRSEYQILRQKALREADKTGGPYSDEDIFKIVS